MSFDIRPDGQSSLFKCVPLMLNQEHQLKLKGTLRLSAAPKHDPRVSGFSDSRLEPRGRSRRASASQ